MSLSRIWAVTPLLTFNGHISGSFSFKKQLIRFFKKSSHRRQPNAKMVLPLIFMCPLACRDFAIHSYTVFGPTIDNNEIIQMASRGGEAGRVDSTRLLSVVKI